MLERSSWKEARELFQQAKVGLIPVGSTEQHGPHLPLGTDFLIAQALAGAAAQETGALCTPVIPVGVASHHQQFWGTLSVSPKAFHSYMKELAQSVATHGMRRIIFVNGHGGNSPTLFEICRELRPRGIFSLVWNWWLNPEVLKLYERLFQSQGSHAGAGETSMILFLDERLVDRSRIEEAVRGASETFGVVKYGAQLPFDTIDFSASGATLDPREASREAGEKIFETARRELIALIRWLETAPEEELKLKPHQP